MSARSVAPLAESERKRLAALLGLLGSDQQGEVINAGRLADRLVRAAGLTWPDVIGLAPAPGKPSPADELLRDWPEHWREAILYCQRFALPKWDRQFIAVVARYHHRPSPKQLEILHSVVQHARDGGVP